MDCANKAHRLPVPYSKYLISQNIAAAKNAFSKNRTVEKETELSWVHNVYI